MRDCFSQKWQGRWFY